MLHSLAAMSAAILLISLLAVASAKDDPKPAPAGGAEPIAVIELFTSEGCSSCPPADALLATLVKDARAKNQRIFPLAFHVDYWNNLGWRDPFSDAAYSDRQRAYAQAFHLDSIYTPQMIVNGHIEFVGSDANQAAQQIAAALKQPAAVSIHLTAKLNDQRDKLWIDYTLTGQTKNCTFNLALAQRNLETKVPRGENANRTLQHDNVVRAFRTIRVEKDKGQIELAILKDVVVNDASLIAYVQDGAFHTLGAALTDFPQQ